MRTETIHERVCALMRDGKPRLVREVADEVGTTYHIAYLVLMNLALEDSLTTVREPGSNRNLYVWNDT